MFSQCNSFQLPKDNAAPHPHEIERYYSRKNVLCHHKYCGKCKEDNRTETDWKMRRGIGYYMPDTERAWKVELERRGVKAGIWKAKLVELREEVALRRVAESLQKSPVHYPQVAGRKKKNKKNSGCVVM
jgi:hypothetical protein